MRTTLSLEDDLAAVLKERAHRSGRPFKEVVNATLRAGLASHTAAKPRAYRLRPSSLGAVMPGIDLDRALSLADALEDDAIAQKLELRK